MLCLLGAPGLGSLGLGVPWLGVPCLGVPGLGFPGLGVPEVGAAEPPAEDPSAGAHSADSVPESRTPLASACGAPTESPVPGARYLFQAFSELDHGASPQSWVVRQDGVGRIWIGNTTGFLEFDGVDWRRHQLPRHHPVRALDVDAGGTVWLAGGKDAGYLAPDEFGRTEFVSVSHRLPADVEFGEFWTVSCNSAGVWFQSDRAVFFESWGAADSVMVAHVAAPAGFGKASMVDDTVYFVDGNANLYAGGDGGEVRKEPLERDGPRLLDPDENFVSYSIVGLAGDLLIASNQGLFRRSADGVLSSFGSPLLRNTIEQYPVYSLEPVGDGLALGTLGAGVLFVDGAGDLTTHLSTDDGFPDDMVLDLYLDHENALWAALDSGIARIEVAGPFLTWESHNRLRGGLQDLHVTED
ncbi:MAG: hypothetical protein R3E97_17410, partial [Candidatus Eisenbacteria bacterium]